MQSCNRATATVLNIKEELPVVAIIFQSQTVTCPQMGHSTRNKQTCSQGPCTCYLLVQLNSVLLM
jgi:hypothetical protein